MISYFSFEEKGLQPVNQLNTGNWICAEVPNEQELNFLKNTFNIPSDFVDDILDADERARTETENGWQLIIMRIPFHQEYSDIPYITVPLGIIMSKDQVISICNYQTEMVADYIRFVQQKQIDVRNPVDFVLNLLLTSTNWFMKYLKRINIQTAQIEKEIEKAVRNKELHQLLKMEKCLVYFITSLKGNDILLIKAKNSRLFKENPVDQDLLEDIETEIKQAIEMSNIYSDILSGMMDAFASIISNNVNEIMKLLTGISIILMIPTLVASLFGMNVPNIFQNNTQGFLIVLLGCAMLSAFGLLLLKRRRLF